MNGAVIKIVIHTKAMDYQDFVNKITHLMDELSNHLNNNNEKI